MRILSRIYMEVRIFRHPNGTTEPVVDGRFRAVREGDVAQAEQREAERDDKQQRHPRDDPAHQSGHG